MATFYNKATLSYNNNTTDSNIATGELVEVLSASKTSLEADYEVNDKVTYLINIVNSGANAFTGLTVTDNLGAYSAGASSVVPLTYVPNSLQYYSSGVLQTTPSVTSDGTTLVITGISVPANGNVLLAFRATVNEYAPLGAGATITNSATISGTSFSKDIVVSEVIKDANAVRLSISKSINPETVVENGEVTYTFVIQNSGSIPATVSDNAVITDTFSPILDPISVTFNNTAWVSPTNYTYDSDTGLFRTVAGQITVPAATYTQDAATGKWSVTPGVSVLKVTGRI